MLVRRSGNGGEECSGCRREVQGMPERSAVDACEKFRELRKGIQG